MAEIILALAVLIESVDEICGLAIVGVVFVWLMYVLLKDI